jgi:alanyl-tRNA synthetase
MSKLPAGGAPAAAAAAAAAPAAAPAVPKMTFEEWKASFPQAYGPGWTGEVVRRSFTEYFTDYNEHTFVPSSRVIPHDDPTLLFANAGMNQYKPIFLGTADPNTPLGKLRAAVNSQKCIRAGGKHNDLDDVGKDVYHHTFFEMLGTWSFNDFYFKEKAIHNAWTLFTEVWKLPKDRLYVTYFEGDEGEGLAPDHEARDFWLALGLDAKHVLPGNKADNFWEMGDTGPCGPCSEIHFDRIGGGRSVPELVNMDDPDVLELWNLVFMQYNRTSDGLRNLPSNHTDTGLGLERITSVLQNKTANYDTDMFMPYFDAIHAGCAVEQVYGGKIGEADVGGIDTAYRVLADHIRTLTIAIVDGGMPDNVGRGYVLRLVLRRAIRFGDEKLGAPPGFFPSLAKIVQHNLGCHFTEITDAKIAYVIEILTEEETQFRKTLTRGQKLFKKAAAGLAEGGVMSGKVAWRLHDTYGFPLDLTKVMAEEQKITIDEVEFLEEKAKAKIISQGGAAALVKSIDYGVNALGELAAAAVPATDDMAKYDYDAAYKHGGLSATVLKLRVAGDVDGVWTESVEAGTEVGVLLDQTNFYAEKGGQKDDTGYMLTASGDEFTVTKCSSRGAYVLHLGTLQGGSLKVGDKLELKMDTDRRLPLMANHTATHILNYGLRQVLGEADQTGSLVEADKLRFDFTAKKALTSVQLAAVEVETRKAIEAKLPVYEKEVSLADAMEIQGLRAMFGEKYPDPVRMISVGAPIEALISDPKSGEATKYSVEFCGGTHVRNSKDCGSFAIIQESAVSKGNRRVECFTGAAADRAIARANEVEGMINADLSPAELIGVEKELLEGGPTPQSRREEIRAQLAVVKKKHVAAAKEKEKALAVISVARAAEIVAEKPKLVVESLAVKGSVKALSQAVQTIKKGSPDTVVMFFSVSEEEGAIQCSAVVPKAIAKAGTISAKEWVESISSIIGGKTGGSAEVGNCRGDVLKLDEAIEAAKKFAAAKLG